MRRHVVAAFVHVPVIRLVFRHGPVEEAFEIHPHRRVRVFVEGQRRRSMFDEHMQQADVDLAQFRELGDDFIGHQMKAATAGFQAYFFLYPHLRMFDQVVLLAVGEIVIDQNGRGGTRIGDGLGIPVYLFADNGAGNQ